MGRRAAKFMILPYKLSKMRPAEEC